MPTTATTARRATGGRPTARPKGSRKARHSGQRTNSNKGKGDGGADSARALRSHRQNQPVSTEEEFKATPLSRMASFPHCPEQTMADPKFRQAVLGTIWPEVWDRKWRKKPDREACLLGLIYGLCGAACAEKAMGVHFDRNHYTQHSKSRYAVDGYSYCMVVSMVKALEETGWLLRRKGNEMAEASTRVWPTDRLVRFLSKLAQDGADLWTPAEQRQAVPLVILKDENKKLIDYAGRKESPRSRRTEKILKQVNAAHACVEVIRSEVGAQGEPAASHASSRSGETAGEPCGEDPEGRMSIFDGDDHSHKADPPSSHRVSHLQEMILPSSSPSLKEGNTVSGTPQSPLNEENPHAILRSFGSKQPPRTDLRATFNRGSWELGGRLYNVGCYGYQNLPSNQREGLLIGGKPVVEVDYSSHHIAMLYADVGLQLEDDPYLAIADDDESLRGTAKKLLLMALNADSRKDAIGAALGDWWDGKDKSVAIFAEAEQRALLNRLYDRMLEIHAPIADFLGSGIGLKLQNRDASMMLDILEEMVIKRGITCLPVHDSAIVREEHEATLREVMLRVYRKHNGGFTCTVKSSSEK
jgi:hypothetical protein